MMPEMGDARLKHPHPAEQARMHKQHDRKGRPAERGRAVNPERMPLTGENGGAKTARQIGAVA